MTQSLLKPAIDPVEDIDAVLERAMASPVWQELNRLRMIQIIHYGHTPESDDMQPVGALVRTAHDQLKKADEKLKMAIDDTTMGGYAGLEVARGRALKAAAILIAFADHADRKLANQPGPGGL